MTSENPPTLNEPREEITDEIKGRPTAHTITPEQLAELHADLDRYEEIQGDMNEQAINDARAIASFEMQLGRLRDQLAILAGNRPTPEQLRSDHAADNDMARRIHQARPGIPVHHILGTLEAFRAVLDMEPGTGPGYCPHCGLGDLAPTPDEYEQQRQRADRAEAVVTRVRAVLEDANHTNMILAKTVQALDEPGPAATQPQPDSTSPIAGRIEVRQPCPYCRDRQMIPRHQFAEHVARLHPDEKPA